MKNILAENLRRFKAKNLHEQPTDPTTATTLSKPAGSSEVKPYKVVQDDTLWSIATKWMQQYAQIQTPSDQQIMNFVKEIVKSTNSLKNLNVNLPGADTQIKDPNLIKPGMTFYLPIDKAEILKVYPQ
jgi:nucleoid-associated protein YgaU